MRWDTSLTSAADAIVMAEFNRHNVRAETIAAISLAVAAQAGSAHRHVALAVESAQMDRERLVRDHGEALRFSCVTMGLIED